VHLVINRISFDFFLVDVADAFENIHQHVSI